MSIRFKKIINLKTDIAKAVKEKIHENNEVFGPPDFAKNSVTYFAIDDTNLKVDAPGGKKQLHGTIIVVYQLRSLGPNEVRSLLQI